MAKVYDTTREAEEKVKSLAFKNRAGDSQIDVLITPDEARVLLSQFNDLNRPMDSNTVLDYAIQMIDGKWKSNGEPIIISDQGNVLDGQHRLKACIEAGIPFRTDVRTGVPEEAFTTIDTGRRRSAANVLNIHGKLTSQVIHHQMAVMASAALCIGYLRDSIKKKGTGGTKISNGDRLQFVIDNPSLRDWVETVKSYKGVYGTYASPVAAVCYFGSKLFEMKAKAFAHGVMTGENLPGGSPMLALRSRLPTTAKDRNPEMLHTWQRFAYVVMAWNFHVDNMERSVLKPTQNSSIPIIRGTEDIPRGRPDDARRRLRGQ